MRRFCSALFVGRSAVGVVCSQELEGLPGRLSCWAVPGDIAKRSFVTSLLDCLKCTAEAN